MKNLKTRTKLLSGFIIIALFSALVAVVAFIGLNQLETGQQEMYKSAYRQSVLASDVETQLHEQRIETLKVALYMLQENDATAQESLDKLPNLEAALRTSCEELESLMPAGSETREIYDDLMSLYNGAFTTFKDNLESAFHSGNAEQAYQEIIQIAPTNAAMVAETQQLVLLNENQAGEKIAQLAVTANRIQIIMIIMGAVAVVASVFLALFNANLIAAPLKKLVAVSRKLSVGDIDVNVETDRKDEIGELSQAFAGIVESIRQQAATLDAIAAGDYTVRIHVRSDKDVMNQAIATMVHNGHDSFAKIRLASGQVNAGAQQLSQAAQTLATGSTEQAASVDQFSANLGSILGQTQKSAENSQTALEATDEAVVFMQQSNNLMERLLEAMASIDESSQNITKIIKVIDDIAFQTNILALNAAVEAARAGQYGKGFAVVAEEVRSLAAKSATAAKETAALIEGSAQRVNEGNEIVDLTNRCLQDIAGSAAKVQTLVREIAGGAAEQVVAISEMNQGLAQISQVVQSNSATSEQTAASAEEMSQQAALLEHAVSGFKLDSTHSLPTGGQPALTSAHVPDQDTNADFFLGKY